MVGVSGPVPGCRVWQGRNMADCTSSQQGRGDEKSMKSSTKTRRSPRIQKNGKHVENESSLKDMRKRDKSESKRSVVNVEATPPAGSVVDRNTTHVDRAGATGELGRAGGEQHGDTRET
ncbi:uncharacterized protein LOC106013827, partial [Aplysia californica]|uniref:Uncharacterized protein LOC106013827 n=1 Tax=Aplysia californica TaxID=6500 RepID=A0ABM1AE85_APLCA